MRFKGGDGNILNRTTDFGAFMRFLPLAYVSVGKPGEVVSAERFRSLFERVSLKDEDFNPDRYKPDTGGESALFRDLCGQTGL